jgi:leucyl-tRNA synthetase
MSSVVVIGAPSDDAHARRLRAVAGAVERRTALAAAGGELRGSDGATAAVDLVRALAGAGRIAVDGDGPWTLWYVPAQATLTALAEGHAPSWGDRIDSRQRKALRRVPGAVFHLPYAAGGGALDVFITDWSPFVAACAIAVHADHEVLTGRDVPARPFFTGRYVRHPLHGDLLPVWAADWVKPEFGTGGVVVNPAHSAADLEFSREVGLPIRFGLGPAEPTTDPSSWLEPPVVKSGRTVRAGRYSGLDHEAAAEAYLRDLEQAGAAERVAAVVLGRAPLATVTASGTGELTWRPAWRAHGLAAPDGTAATVQPAPLLAAAAALLDGGPPLVVAADALTADLLWLRLLTADLAGAGVGSVPVPADVTVVAKVGSVKDVPAQWLDRTLLVAGQPDEVVPVRGQLADQVAKAVGEHQPATARLVSAPPDEDEPAAAKAAARTLDALAVGDFAAAFSGVAATAKTLRRGGIPGRAQAQAYLRAMHVLFDLPLPAVPSVPVAARPGSA